MSTWDPQDYSRHSANQQQWARELIAKLQLRGDERVLDIGCGDGKVTAEIAAQCGDGSVLGLDSSPDMIGFASNAFPVARHPNLCFVVGDAAALAFEREFDVVFSNAALHWVYDHRPILAGIFAALKPAGRAVLQMGGQGNADEVMDAALAVMGSPRWSAHFAGFSFRYGFHGPEQYRTWLMDAGLQPVRVELMPKDMQHAGIEGFTAWVRTTWIPFIQAVPSSAQPAFIQDLVSRYIAAHPPDRRGIVHVKMVRLEVEAIKQAVSPPPRHNN